MLGKQFLLASIALGLASASAIPASGSSLLKRVVPECDTATDPTCCNNSADRTKWCGGFDVNSDSELVYPPNGKEVPYTLNVAAQRMSPDGTEKDLLVINGQYPGPMITANWGDTLVITVNNRMTDNGTSMHWHGVIQANTTTQDGANGVTECPIPPGGSRTYRFIATQHGTTWYHSHYSGQYGDGVLGTMLIRGPASAQYQEDLGTFPITDWYRDNMYQMTAKAEPAGAGPPPSESGLINGTMKVGDVGAYSRTILKPNTTYRLRLINTAVEQSFVVSLDGHNFTAIAADFVPIKPFVSPSGWLFIGIGQRYDVVFTTGNETTGNFWFRAEVPSFFCGTNNLGANMRAVFSINDTPGDPAESTPARPKTTVCQEEAGISAALTKAVPKSEFTFTHSKSDELNITLATRIKESTGTNINSWEVNESNIDIEWDNPTLEYVLNGQTAQITDSNHTHLNVYSMPEANKYYFWVIQGNFLPHPIHLHGHDFFILGQKSGVFSGSQAEIDALNFDTPLRRDVAMLPAGGYMVIAIHTNNPGVWLMHCHIGTHVGMGLSVQFIERESEILGLQRAPLEQMERECSLWDAWYSTTPFKKPDSGLKRDVPHLVRKSVTIG